MKPVYAIIMAQIERKENGVKRNAFFILWISFLAALSIALFGGCADRQTSESSPVSEDADSVVVEKTENGWKEADESDLDRTVGTSASFLGEDGAPIADLPVTFYDDDSVFSSLTTNESGAVSVGALPYDADLVCEAERLGRTASSVFRFLLSDEGLSVYMDDDVTVVSPNADLNGALSADLIFLLGSNDETAVLPGGAAQDDSGFVIAMRWSD